MSEIKDHFSFPAYLYPCPPRGLTPLVAIIRKSRTATFLALAAAESQSFSPPSLTFACSLVSSSRRGSVLIGESCLLLRCALSLSLTCEMERVQSHLLSSNKSLLPISLCAFLRFFPLRVLYNKGISIILIFWLFMGLNTNPLINKVQWKNNAFVKPR